MQAKPLRGVHVLWMIIAFFAVIVGADVFFIVRAVETFPGEQVKNSYVLGLDYNREVESRAKQAELGWSLEAGVQRAAIASSIAYGAGDKSAGEQHLVVRVADAAQTPVSDLYVVVSYFTAGSGTDERAVELTERQPGEYAAPVEIAVGRRVEFSIAARRDASDAPVFRASKTVVIS